MQDHNEGRRNYLKLGAYVVGATVLGGTSSGFFSEGGKDIYAFLKGLLNNKAKRHHKIPTGIEYLLGDNPHNTGILPPGTNRNLLAKGVMQPSRYVRKAFDVSTAMQKQLLGVKQHVEINHDDKRLNADQDENLLIIGGPVSTDFTRTICGYTDSENKKNPKKPVPVIDDRCPLPYYFYVGNENGYGYWGDEYRNGVRKHESGTEDLFPVYGIYHKEKDLYVPQPMSGNKVVGDMLMIIRVPNPENISGTITIVGGIHGYSLENFFTDIEDSLEKFIKFYNPQGKKYFQALLPYQIHNGEFATMNLSGQADWRSEFKEIDPKAFLSYIS